MTKVMIVDDDRTTVSLLQTLLELDGYEVVVVARGMDVIPKVEQERPELIMLDYHLADTDGVTVIHDLRNHAKFAQIPILVASGIDVSQEVLAAGADDFLVKPFEPSDLPAIFNRLIGQ